MSFLSRSESDRSPFLSDDTKEAILFLLLAVHHVSAPLLAFVRSAGMPLVGVQEYAKLLRLFQRQHACALFATEVLEGVRLRALVNRAARAPQ